MLALPSWISHESWTGFIETRRAMRRPFTDRAQKMILKELQKIKDAGHCPNAALDQSTLHGWMDVYPPKEKPILRASGHVDEAWKQDYESAKQASQTPEARAAAQKVRELFVRRA